MMEYVNIVGQHLLLLGLAIAVGRTARDTISVIEMFELGFWKVALSRSMAIVILIGLSIAVLGLLRKWGGPVWFLELLA